MDGAVRCPLCDARGTVRPAAGGVAAEFGRRAHDRFSPAGRAEHVGLLTEIRQRYLAGRSELYERRKPYEAMDWWAKR